MVYKFMKAPAMLGLALALTFWPQVVAGDLRALVSGLSGWGALAERAGHWIEVHLTPRLEQRLAIIAWLDGVSTTIEGALLAYGRSWGEWLVVVGLTALLPFEVWSLVRQVSVARAAVFGLNVVVAVYLWRRRWTSARARAPGPTRS